MTFTTLYVAMIVGTHALSVQTETLTECEAQARAQIETIAQHYGEWTRPKWWGCTPMKFTVPTK
jgi:hypothetical protein